ncbi:MAG TPA: response regulator [Candidatus Sulfotelmatobacter sp.]|nr:response regulator [Candidatus Sulfotelmatobacter sp.]
MPKVALVVDDSMLMRYTVCRFLEEHGYAVESASNGAEALELLENLSPELIVTDLQMPKMSGEELISAVKGKSELAGVPIIVVAGRARNVEKPQHQADFVIDKDVDIDMQLGKALKVVERQSARTQKAGK